MTTTFKTMGTVVSIRSGIGMAIPPDVALAVEAVFQAYDRTYSLYDSRSALSAVAAGELRLSDADEAIRDMYALALDWRTRTRGTFTPHRPDGVIELSGIVKAVAIRDAGDILDEALDSWLINAGGDALTRGDHHGTPWSIGIVDPDHRDALAGVVPITGGFRALATSGTAERGEHIWRRSGPTFVQASVLAPDIVAADVIATAIIAGDETDLQHLTQDGSVDVLAFDVDGRAWATSGGAAWSTVR